MTAEIKLNAKTRKKKEKADKNKTVAAIMYGPEIEKNKMLWIDRQTFNKVYQEAGESTLIDLKIDEEEKPYEVLVYDVQSDPIANKCLHVDFLKVKKGKKIETEVELEFIGEAPAVKEAGAVLIKNVDHLEIRCLPKDLPKEIKVDISFLKKIGDTIHIKELNLPEGVEPLWDAETVVAMTEAPRSEKELEELNEKVEVDMDKVGEVEKKEKKEEETAEGETENVGEPAKKE